MCAAYYQQHPFWAQTGSPGSTNMVTSSRPPPSQYHPQIYNPCWPSSSFEANSYGMFHNTSNNSYFTKSPVNNNNNNSIQNAYNQYQSHLDTFGNNRPFRNSATGCLIENSSQFLTSEESGQVKVPIIVSKYDESSSSPIANSPVNTNLVGMLIVSVCTFNACMSNVYPTYNFFIFLVEQNQSSSTSPQVTAFNNSHCKPTPINNPLKSNLITNISPPSFLQKSDAQQQHEQKLSISLSQFEPKKWQTFPAKNSLVNAAAAAVEMKKEHAEEILRSRSNNSSRSTVEEEEELSPLAKHNSSSPILIGKTYPWMKLHGKSNKYKEIK